MDGSRLKKVASQLALVMAGSAMTVLLLGGGPAGAFNVPNNSVTSAKIVNSTIQGIDIKDGAIGPVDLAPRARARWARVNAGANTFVDRGRGAVSASRAGTGVYDVVFADPIADCGWTVSVNDLDIFSSFGGRSHNIEAITPNTLRVVFIRNDVLDDIPDPHGFTLVAHC